MEAIALVLTLVAAQNDPIEELIHQLGADEVEAREKAAAELLKRGPSAEARLRKALSNPDAEVRWRARRVLEEIERRAFAETFLDSRTKGKARCLEKGGGSMETEAAVLGALKWLGRHQSPDGSWKSRERDRPCPVRRDCRVGLVFPDHDECDLGVTGLALLAFLGAGHTPASKEEREGVRFGDVVRKGLEWVKLRQDREGLIGSRDAQKYMYFHSLT